MNDDVSKQYPKCSDCAHCVAIFSGNDGICAVRKKIVFNPVDGIDVEETIEVSIIWERRSGITAVGKDIYNESFPINGLKCGKEGAFHERRLPKA